MDRMHDQAQEHLEGEINLNSQMKMITTGVERGLKQDPKKCIKP